METMTPVSPRGPADRVGSVSGQTVGTGRRAAPSVLWSVLGDQVSDPAVDLFGDVSTRVVQSDRQVGVAVELLALRRVLVVELDLAEDGVNVFFPEGWHLKRPRSPARRRGQFPDKVLAPIYIQQLTFLRKLVSLLLVASSSVTHGQDLVQLIDEVRDLV